MPEEERRELDRIRREGFARRLPVGDVRAYVLSPDGHPAYILPTDRSSTMLSALDQAAGHFKPAAGKPAVPLAVQSAPPPAPPDAVTLHLVSRGDDRGSWGEFPAENWIVLRREEWEALLPGGEVGPGHIWELDRNITAKILTYFYPQTENNNATTARIQDQGLTAKALTVKDGVVTARLDGFVRMQHAFYPGRKDAQPLQADVVGVLTFAPHQPPSLQLATTNAVHGRRPFKVAVVTVRE